MTNYTNLGALSQNGRTGIYMAISLSLGYERILSFYHSIGSPIDGAHPGLKTNRDYHFSFFPSAVSKVYGQ